MAHAAREHALKQGTGPCSIHHRQGPVQQIGFWVHEIARYGNAEGPEVHGIARYLVAPGAKGSRIASGGNSGTLPACGR